MKIAATVIALAAAACAADPDPQPTVAHRGVAYVCYTHAICTAYESTARNVEHRLCLEVDPKVDVLEPGDAAAESWASEWAGSCAALEGTIGGPLEGHVCAVPDSLNPSTYDHVPYGCSVDCEPLFEGC